MDNSFLYKYRSSLAHKLVWVANRLVKPKTETLTYNFWPKFRPIDQDIKREGSYAAHKYACGAYSYEHLKSYSEQDGPDGACAKTTVKDFISEKGWKDVADIDPKELRRSFAMSGIDMEDADDGIKNGK